MKKYSKEEKAMWLEDWQESGNWVNKRVMENQTKKGTERNCVKSREFSNEL